jgi:WD40 repeat protein
MRRAALLLLACGCQTLPRVPDATLAQLASQRGSWLTGAVRGLGEEKVLNAEDFIYDAKFSPDSQRVALSRLGMKSFDLLVWSLATPPAQVCSASINLHEFDVESVEFSPDGGWVAAVSRDGSVRAYDAATGQPAGAWLTEEPLTTVAFAPGGGYLAIGSEKGLVTVLEVVVEGEGAPNRSSREQSRDAGPSTGGGKLHFRFATEVRAHSGQVRALAFAQDGRLFTGGWDKTIAVFSTEERPAPTGEAAVHFEHKGGFAQVRGNLNDVASVLFALDARMPQVVVLRSALAQAVGVDPSRLTDTVNVVSSFGTQVAKVAHGVRLAFKGMKLEGQDAVICDACIPADAQAVLGQGFSDAVDVAFDDAAGQALLRRKGVAGTGEPLLALTEAKRFTFPAFVNDLSVDRAGKVLGVAFSEAKGERTRDVYEREKKGEVEPAREWDVGARVDAETGAVLQKLTGHHGVVATAGISPDGATLATGGWDKHVLLHVAGAEPVLEKFGWAIRRVRFSPDGRWLGVGAWTPQNPLGDHKSTRSAIVWEVAYDPVGVGGIFR